MQNLYFLKYGIVLIDFILGSTEKNLGEKHPGSIFLRHLISNVQPDSRCLRLWYLMYMRDSYLVYTPPHSTLTQP